MASIDPGKFEREMTTLNALVEQLKDQSLPLEQLAPLVENALAQAGVCDQLLRDEEGAVAVVIKKHVDMLNRLRGSRYL